MRQLYTEYSSDLGSTNLLKTIPDYPMFLSIIHLRRLYLSQAKADAQKDQLGKADLFGARLPSHHLFSPHRPPDIQMQPGLFPHGKIRTVLRFAPSRKR